MGFKLGNVVKYIARARLKGQELSDLKKALDYTYKLGVEQREWARWCIHRTDPQGNGYKPVDKEHEALVVRCISSWELPGRRSALIINLLFPQVDTLATTIRVLEEEITYVQSTQGDQGLTPAS